MDRILSLYPAGLQNADQVIIPEIPAGLPSTLLEQRPDVKAAEDMLVAETERIGVAQAMRLPSFSLTGLFGLASTDLNYSAYRRCTCRWRNRHDNGTYF